MSLRKAIHALVNSFWHPSDKIFTREGRGLVHSGTLLYLTLQMEGEAWGHGVEKSWKSVTEAWGHGEAPPTSMNQLCWLFRGPELSAW